MQFTQEWLLFFFFFNRK